MIGGYGGYLGMMGGITPGLVPGGLNASFHTGYIHGVIPQDPGCPYRLGESMPAVLAIFAAGLLRSETPVLSRAAAAT